MATASATRKKFRVVPMLQHATTMLTQRTMMVLANNSTRAAYAEAMVFRLAHAIAPATSSMPAVYVVAMASQQGLAIARATSSTSAASAEAMALRRAHVIALATYWMPAESAVVQV